MRQIRQAGGEATAVRADLSDPAEVQPLFDAARETYGRVDILVNNAGVAVTWPVEEASPARYEELFNLNVRGPLLTTAAFARQVGPEGGRVINISSGAARAMIPGLTAYSATKAALEAMTRGHAAELGPKKITVNAVVPGVTDTEISSCSCRETVRSGLVSWARSSGSPV